MFVYLTSSSNRVQHSFHKIAFPARSWLNLRITQFTLQQNILFYVKPVPARHLYVFNVKPSDLPPTVIINAWIPNIGFSKIDIIYPLNISLHVFLLTDKHSQLLRVNPYVGSVLALVYQVRRKCIGARVSGPGIITAVLGSVNKRR